MKKILVIAFIIIIASSIYYRNKYPMQQPNLTPMQMDSVWCDTTSEVCGITEDTPTPEQQDSLKAIGKENEIYKLLK